MGETFNIDRKPFSVQSFIGSKSKYTKHTKSPLAIPLGKGWMNQKLILDLQRNPHFLVSGMKGSGKTNFIKTLMASFAIIHKPKTIRYLVITSNPSEFDSIKKSKYLRGPINNTAKKILNTMKNLDAEMLSRYRLLAEHGHRNLVEYNNNMKDRLPYTLLFVDNFSKLTQNFTSKQLEEISKITTRLLSMAKATGTHLIFTTESLSPKIVPEPINYNFMTRMALKTASKKDSLAIIDIPGAETLSGNGDAIISHHNDGGIAILIQTPLTTEQTLAKLLK